MILGKYNQAKTITFDLFEIDGIDLSVAATFAAGDVKIQKDEGVEANTTNLPTDEGSTYSLVLTAAEMSAARIRIIIIDQTATKVWLDTSIGIETYGNASAEHAFDLDTASTAQTADHTAGIADIPTVAEFNARTLLAANYFDPAVDVVANVTLVDTTTTNTDMRGTDNAALATSLATAQLDLDTITGADGVTLATTQGAITWGAVTISVADGLNNITLAGSGSADGLAYTRIGTGSLFDTAWAAALESEVTDALTAYAPATEAKQDIIDTVVDGIKVTTDKFVFTVANQVDSNIQSINDVTITGDGSATPFDV